MSSPPSRFRRALLHFERMVPHPIAPIHGAEPDGLHSKIVLFGAIVMVHVLALGVYVLMARGYGGFFKAVCVWDCRWYTGLVRRGYDLHAIAGPQFKGVVNWVFFPLYPLASRLFCAITGTSADRGPIMLNLLLLPIMVWMSVQYGLRRKIIGSAGCAMLVLLAAPWGIYYRSGYTETLYGLLLIGALWLAESRRLLPTCLCLALTSLTRPTGILVALVTAVHHAARQRGEVRFMRRRLAESAVLLAAGAAGLAAFMIHLYLLTGDPLAFLHAEATFSRQVSGNSFAHLFAGLMRFDVLALTSYNSQSEFLKAIMGVLASLLMMWLAWRTFYAEAAIVVLTLLMAAASGSLLAVPRYMFANPLTLLALSSLIERFPPPIKTASLAGLAAGQAGFIFLWYHNALVLV